MRLPKVTPACLAPALFLAQVSAHSWVEQMQVIDKTSGTYIGNPGYSRGYIPRDQPGFNDNLMTYLLPPNSAGTTRVSASDLLCSPTQQQPDTNASFPQLNASPGDYVAMKYLENGHVSLPQNQVGKPGSAGVVYIYATTNPKVGETLTNVLSWNFNGTLSDGRLLAVQNFDDGRCYQLNGGAISTQRQAASPDPVLGQPGSSHEQWCESNVQVPDDAPAGSLAVYWVWQWPTLPGRDPGIPDGKDEVYTTCSDWIIGSSGTQAKAANGQEAKLNQQDPQSKAVSNFKARAANQTLPADAFFLGPNSPAAAASSSGTTTGAGTVLTSSSVIAPGSQSTSASSSVVAPGSKSTSTTTAVAAPTTSSSVIAPGSKSTSTTTAGAAAPTTSSISAPTTTVASLAPAGSMMTIVFTAVVTTTVTTEVQMAQLAGPTGGPLAVVFPRHPREFRRFRG